MLNVLSRNNRFLFNIAEKSYFPLDVFWKELVLGATQKYVWLNSYLEKFLYAVLRRFCFQFSGGGHIGNICKVDEKRVLLTKIRSQLPYRLKKRKTFYVSHRTADLDYDHVVTVLKGTDAGFYLICYVRNYLDCFAEKLAFPLLGNNGIVDLATCQIVFLAEAGLGKSFVMT